VARQKDGPLDGAIHLAASLRSRVLVVVVMTMETVLMMLNVRLRAWYRANRERNSSNSGQNESKVSHEHYSSTGFLSVQKMAKASSRVKQIFMNGRSGRGIHGRRRGRI
jgi:hypothetical protein